MRYKKKSKQSERDVKNDYTFELKSYNCDNTHDKRLQEKWEI